MTAGDRVVERSSTRLRGLSEKMANRGGMAQKLARPLAEDAAFVRKLKPSLIYARARGRAPTNGRPDPVSLPAGEQAKRRKKGVNPFLVIGVAFAVGYVAAKTIDWRGHAHPDN
jgi:hypothetical protein